MSIVRTGDLVDVAKRAARDRGKGAHAPRSALFV